MSGSFQERNRRLACARLDDSHFKKYGKDAVHEETAVLALGTENPLATPLSARGFNSREPPSHPSFLVHIHCRIEDSGVLPDAKGLNNAAGNRPDAVFGVKNPLPS